MLSIIDYRLPEDPQPPKLHPQKPPKLEPPHREEPQPLPPNQISLTPRPHRPQNNAIKIEKSKKIYEIIAATRKLAITKVIKKVSTNPVPA